MFLTEKLHDVLQTVRICLHPIPPQSLNPVFKTIILLYSTSENYTSETYYILSTHTRARGWSGSDDYYHNYYIILILDKRVR